MNRGSPSLVALLGLLAVAGYQNRDKLSSVLQGASGSGADTMPGGAQYGTSVPSSGGKTDSLQGMMGSAGSANASGNASGGLMAGLSEILGRFKNPVQAAKADSWVATGPNGSLSAAELDEVMDEDTTAELMQRTGLDRTELLHRLSTVLPDAVDQMTPDGHIPTLQEPRTTI